MDTPHPPDALTTLGRALQLRRIHLGYPQRRRFVLERGSRKMEKTVARLERGERPTYSAATAAKIEKLYALAEGSFWDSVRTGKLTVSASQDPVADDLRRAVMALPGLTDDEKRTVHAVARGLRAERAGAPAEPARQEPEQVLDDDVLAGMDALAAQVADEEPAHRRAAS